MSEHSAESDDAGLRVGASVLVASLGVTGTVTGIDDKPLHPGVGRDGYGFDGVAVIFDEPAPRGFEDGCCAGVEQCEVLASTSLTSPGEVTR